MLSAAAALPAIAGCASLSAPLSPDQAREQVRSAELGFAATMARRDLAAFGSFVAEDSVFINGGSPLRGKAAIVQHWSRYFKEPQPPFSWEPQLVEVASNAGLGYTEGPVTSNAVVIARFFSTWQRQADGRWLVVFDNGYSECKR